MTAVGIHPFLVTVRDKDDSGKADFEILSALAAANLEIAQLRKQLEFQICRIAKIHEDLRHVLEHD